MESDATLPEYYKERESKPSFWDNIKKDFVELVEFVAVLAAIFIFIRLIIAEPHKVSGSSMVPNFHDGDYLITNKLATNFSEPARGEVIILKNPRDINKVFIKRVIGLPKDKLMISGGKIYINDKIIGEPYLPADTIIKGGSYLKEAVTIIVPEGQYFVMGDNREGSSDSREWGPVQKDLIIGQAYLRYWPLQKAEILKLGEASN